MLYKYLLHCGVKYASAKWVHAVDMETAVHTGSSVCKQTVKVNIQAASVMTDQPCVLSAKPQSMHLSQYRSAWLFCDVFTFIRCF